MVKAHTHKFKVVSVNCQAGTQTLKCKCNKTKIVHIKKGHRFRKTKDGLYTVNKCLSCGKVNKKYLSKNIPTYWDRHIDKALKTAKKHGDLPGYVFLTDPHWQKNAGNSPAIINYVAKQMGYTPPKKMRQSFLCPSFFLLTFFDCRLIRLVQAGASTLSRERRVQRGHIDHVHTPTPDVRDGAILAPITQVILTETRRTTGIHNPLISGRWIIVIFVFAHR